MPKIHVGAYGREEFTGCSFLMKMAKGTAKQQSPLVDPPFDHVYVHLDPIINIIIHRNVETPKTKRETSEYPNKITKKTKELSISDERNTSEFENVEDLPNIEDVDLKIDLSKLVSTCENLDGHAQKKSSRSKPVHKIPHHGKTIHEDCTDSLTYSSLNPSREKVIIQEVVDQLNQIVDTFEPNKGLHVLFEGPNLLDPNREDILKKIKKNGFTSYNELMTNLESHILEWSKNVKKTPFGVIVTKNTIPEESKFKIFNLISIHKDGHPNITHLIYSPNSHLFVPMFFCDKPNLYQCVKCIAKDRDKLLLVLLQTKVSDEIYS